MRSAAVAAVLALAGTAPAQSLQQQLAAEPVAALAKAAAERGDADRGAVLFFQPALSCAKCHDGEATARLGPADALTLTDPAPVTVEPWVTMDYGPSLTNTYEVGGPGPNIAYKGVAVRLDPGPGGVSRGKRWACSTTTPCGSRRPGAATGSSTGRGFTSTASTKFTRGSWATWRCRTRSARGGRTRRPAASPTRGSAAATAGPTVGDAAVLEVGGAEPDPARPAAVVYTRTLEVGKSSRDLLCRVAPAGVAAAVVGDSRVSLAACHSPRPTGSPYAPSPPPQRPPA